MSAENHWVPADDQLCTCLTRDSRGEFPHAANCEVRNERPVLVDDSDIRELAEIAANSDIDTAVAIYRAYLKRGAK